MKFFDEKWYAKMQLSGMLSGFHGVSGADVPSDEFYLKQYEKWIKGQLAYEKKVADMSFEASFPAPVKADMKYIPQSEVQKIKDEYEENLPQYKKMYDERPKYDEERLRAEYKLTAEEHEKQVVAMLPAEILDQIKDTRLLGIDVVSPEVKKQMNKMAKSATKSVEKTLKDYERYYKKLADKLPPELTSERLDAGGSMILTYTADGDTVRLTFDTECSYSNVCEMIFTGVTKVSGDPTGACWLYDEVGVTDSGYSLGILFARGEDNASCFECEFKEIKTVTKTR